MYTYLTRLPDCNPGLDEDFLCCLHDDHRYQLDCEHNSEHQHHAVMIVNVQQLQRWLASSNGERKMALAF